MPLAWPACAWPRHLHGCTPKAHNPPTCRSQRRAHTRARRIRVHRHVLPVCGMGANLLSRYGGLWVPAYLPRYRRSYIWHAPGHGPSPYGAPSPSSWQRTGVHRDDHTRLRTPVIRLIHRAQAPPHPALHPSLKRVVIGPSWLSGPLPVARQLLPLCGWQPGGGTPWSRLPPTEPSHSSGLIRASDPTLLPSQPVHRGCAERRHGPAHTCRAVAGLTHMPAGLPGCRHCCPLPPHASSSSRTALRARLDVGEPAPQAQCSTDHQPHQSEPYRRDTPTTYMHM
jgi:hypothetical protein